MPRARLKVDLLIFDLDGTLIDSRRDIAEAVNHALATLGLPPLPHERIASYVGDGTAELIRRSLGPRHTALLEPALAAFMDHYSRHLVDHTTLYPHAKETLDRYAHKPMALISNKPERLVRAILEALRIAPYFTWVLGGDSLPRKKPDPAPVVRVLEASGVRCNRALMIGDSPTDIQAGRAAGTRTCGVTYGYKPPETVAAAGPDLLIASLEELPRHVC